MHRQVTSAVALLCIFFDVQGVVAQRIDVVTLKPEIIDTRLRMVVQKNSDRMLCLKSLLETLNCPSVQVADQQVPRRKLPNIACKLPGETDQEIVVGAHYDSSPDFGDGAIDNWSGASLLPSLVESLCAHPRRHTFTFVAFEGEEAGLVGSKHYVKQLSRECRARIRAMINLDCLGLSGTKIDTYKSDKQLIALMARVAAHLKVPLEGLDAHRVGQTDSDSFADVRIPVLSLHSITQENLSTLHSLKDRLDAIRTQDYYDTYRLVSLYLAYLDTALPN